VGTGTLSCRDPRGVQITAPVESNRREIKAFACPEFIEGKKMAEEINHDRRRFLATALMTIGSAELGMIGSSAAQSSKVKAATVPASKPGTNRSFGPLKQIDAGLLNVGYAEIGPSGGTPVILLHGWPYDIHSYVDVAPLLASTGYRVIVPYVRGYGTTRFLSNDTFRNGQPSAIAVDTIAFMDALRIDKAILAGFDWGARTANIIAALRPERCKAMVSVSGYLIGSQEAGRMPLPPKNELEWWYQYYFATERGRAGYDKYRHDFAKLIWQIASPKWKFDDATFERSAASFNNPDHVSIVIHNYRWRLGLAEGEPKYDDLEKRLAEFPVIRVPTITLQGDADGAPRPDASSYAKKFSGKYSHRIIKGGIGHNLPQEAPQAFAKAVVDVDRY
jgi:pimeloyl-ACP methyl ester carboxylesterase